MGADAVGEPSTTNSSEETNSGGQREQKTGFTGDGFTEQRDFSEECDSLMHKWRVSTWLCQVQLMLEMCRDMEEYRKATHAAFYELSKIVNDEEETKTSINLAGRGRAGRISECISECHCRYM